MEATELGPPPRLIPREVVALRRGPGGPIAGGYTGTLGRISESRAFKTVEGDLTLELHVTLPGDEGSLLAALGRRRDVLAASQNVLGTTQEASRAPSREPPARQWFLGETGPDPSIQPIGDDRLAGVLAPAWHGTPTVVVIDAEPAHCVRVMESVMAGYRARGAATGAAAPAPTTCAVIGLCLVGADATFATLHRYADLLLSTAALHRDVLALNLSVDFGCVVLGGGLPGGAGHTAPPLDLISYSLPFFEVALRIATRTMQAGSARLRTRALRKPADFDGGSSSLQPAQGVRPAAFAPAGNSLPGRLRRRMAYPAIRPEVVAATLVAREPEKGWVLAPGADFPAVYDLKPCVGVAARDLPHTSGTSHACAWLAGAFAAYVSRQAEWPEQDKGNNDLDPPEIAIAGPLAKTAAVLALTETKQLPGPDEGPSASIAILDRAEPLKRSTLLDHLLRELNELDPETEFAITGSTAAVALAVPGGTPGTLRHIFSALGDVDLLHSGRATDEVLSKAVAVARGWVESEVGRKTWRGGPLSVELHPLHERVSANALLECVVPASAVFLTTEGAIDAWGGTHEVERGVLTVSILTDRAAWRFNPSFQLGSNGVATGLLIWVSHVLLLKLARHFAQSPGGMSADPVTLETARRLVRECDAELLFGMALDQDDAVLRRLDRARGLLARLTQDRIAVGPVSQLVDEISGRLERALAAIPSDSRQGDPVLPLH